MLLMQDADEFDKGNASPDIGPTALKKEAAAV
jgi:hypothetical protein